MKLIEKIKLFLFKLFKGSLFDDIDKAIYYICGAESLPQPLSSEEEEVYIQQMNEGNSVAKDVLIEHNLRLVVFIAKKFISSSIAMEDLISVGAVGLIKAVRTYKFDKNIKLATYASRCIENEILMSLRKSVKLKVEMSLDEPLSFDGEGNEFLLSDILSTEESSIVDDMEKQVDNNLLILCLEKLSEKEREIMEYRFGLSGKEIKTQKEVADMFGISQSYISRIEKKILERLKKEFEKENALA
ncbi:MAG: RNA polymerase sporulation sigma factor SigK [Clostridia bacterium]